MDSNQREKIILSLENHQIRSKTSLIGGVDFYNKSDILSKFHKILLDPKISIEEILDFVQVNLPVGSIPIHEGLVEIAVEIARRGTFFLTPVEPINTSIYILNAIHLIVENVELGKSIDEIFICTDHSYRPHASVQVVEENSYAIILGYYLFMDCYLMSATYYDLIFRARDGKNIEFSEVFSSKYLIPILRTSHHMWQMPCILAGTVLGEKLRCAAIFPESLLTEKSGYVTQFSMLMHVFIIAHEIGHVFSGHLSLKSSSMVQREIVVSLLDTYFSEEPAEEIQKKIYINRYLNRHCEEFQADDFALQQCINTSVDLFGSRLPGIAAAFVVINLISMFDKIFHYATTGQNVTKIVGITKFNRVPFSVEFRLPRRSHPWGKTRLFMLQHSNYISNHLDCDFNHEKVEINQEIFNTIAEGAHSVISQCDIEAIKLSNEVLKKDGEIVVSVLSEGILIMQNFKEKPTESFMIDNESFLKGDWRHL
jgi:hypothetical protein